MSDTVIGLLIFLPLILSVIVTIFFGRQLTCWPLFLVISALSLLGLQSLLAPVSIGIFMPNMGGLTAATANEAFSRSIIFGAVIQVFIGLPILWWLKRALQQP